MNKTIHLFDPFAGRGIYEDGTYGSPLIMLDCARKNLKGPARTRLRFHFSDIEHASDLGENVDRLFPEFSAQVECVPADFESLPDRLSTIGSDNAFFYIDPFGIKHLDAALYERICSLPGSSEILLNFNSIGFLRESARILALPTPEEPDDVDAESETVGAAGMEGRARLTRAYGSDFWTTGAKAYAAGSYPTFWDYERAVTSCFIEGAAPFSFVLNIPVKEDYTKPALKYRMVFMTNHYRGCEVMATTMEKRFRDRHDSLFPLTADGQPIDDSEVKRRVASIIERLSEWVVVGGVYARFACEYGIGVSRADLCRHLAALEEEGVLERRVKTTPTGRPARGWGRDVSIRPVKQ